MEKNPLEHRIFVHPSTIFFILHWSFFSCDSTGFEWCQVDVTKRARNLWREIEWDMWKKGVHKGVCSIKHEQWFIYVFFRRPSVSFCVCVFDELVEHENDGRMEVILNIKDCIDVMDMLLMLPSQHIFFWWAAFFSKMKI